MTARPPGGAVTASESRRDRDGHGPTAAGATASSVLVTVGTRPARHRDDEVTPSRIHSSCVPDSLASKFQVQTWQSRDTHCRSVKKSLARSRGGGGPAGPSHWAAGHSDRPSHAGMVTGPRRGRPARRPSPGPGVTGLSDHARRSRSSGNP